MSSRHLQSNGQAEATNKALLDILKKKLGNRKGAWAEELPEVLWAYRTTVKTLMGETSFSLTYRQEAILPVEIRMPKYRVQHVDPKANDAKLADELNFFLEEGRIVAEMRIVTHKRKEEQSFK